MASSSIPLHRWIALAALALASLALGLAHPLQNVNEGLYARIALEMLASGDWVVPTLHGVPYLEKPPLTYWATATAFGMFGVNEIAARVAPVIGVMLTLGASAFLAWRHGSARAAAIAVVVGASSPVLVIMGRTLLLDALFTGLLAVSIAALDEGLRTARRPRAWMCASYAALALAVLAKGFAAIVFHAAVALALVLSVPSERGQRARRWLDVRALGVFAAIALPWHLLAAWREPSFAWFYVVNEHVMRLLDARVPRDYHNGPPWYYVPRLLAYAWPWTLLLLLPRRAHAPAGRSLRALLWTWFLVPFVLFSAAGSKADYYMMVAMPPMIVAVALRLDALMHTRIPAIVAGGGALLWGGAWLATAHWSGRFALPAAAWLACAFGLAACLAGAWLFLRRRAEAAMVAVALTAVPLALLYSDFLAANGDWKSARATAAMLDRMGVERIYLYRDYEAVSALPFYWRRDLVVIDCDSKDLWFGRRLRPASAGFVEAGGMPPSTERYAIVVTAQRLAEFREKALPRALREDAVLGALHIFTSPATATLASVTTPDAARAGRDAARSTPGRTTAVAR